ncbi:deoxynucleoside triphosphate triphosphohydrolase SAMHD1-like [Physella acuta]|uniref:deoxynucleoside triphosphate triphosphohydrolase SAMHD1-like n=1 Tax=Physella acuta TaxID=109671 RepID=UPI0027DD2FFF|nr:deoxynucleoside triphosphate triphosphohydrolase SAMHD1-like [Physella acuta]
MDDSTHEKSLDNSADQVDLHTSTPDRKEPNDAQKEAPNSPSNVELDFKFPKPEAILKKNITIGKYLNEVKVKRTEISFKDIDLKVYNDPVHGHIQTNKACQAIVDTPQFQRLRFLRKLGMVYFVFPGAAHNRFEHSLGTCHLAGMFVRALQSNQPFLGITERDILCVEIAALCHDLGHGILSDFYLQQFMPKYRQNKSPIKREKLSVKMFEALLEENGLYTKEGGGRLRDDFGLDNDDIEFIKEQILGEEKYKDGTWILKGRGKEKEYLYEIVSNKRTGIDVDEFDCLARDCHHIGIKNNFDYARYIKFARVIEVDGKMQICIRHKESTNLYNMFYTKYTLHRSAYQHKVKCAIEAMVNNALDKANPHMNLSKWHKDTKEFLKLTDNVLFEILYSNEENLKESKKLIERIFSRELYVTAYESRLMSPEALEHYGGGNDESISQKILQLAKEIGVPLSNEDFIVDVARINFGMNNSNPLAKLMVYRKNDVDAASPLNPEELSQILAPSKFKEIIVRVYSTKSDKDESIRKVCEKMFNVNVQSSGHLEDQCSPQQPFCVVKDVLHSVVSIKLG